MRPGTDVKLYKTRAQLHLQLLHLTLTVLLLALKEQALAVTLHLIERSPVVIYPLRGAGLVLRDIVTAIELRRPVKGTPALNKLQYFLSLHFKGRPLLPSIKPTRRQSQHPCNNIKTELLWELVVILYDMCVASSCPLDMEERKVLGERKVTR